MPTNKQVEKSIRRIHYHMTHLQRALNEAHNLDVIAYNGTYGDQAPCWAMDQLRERVRLTTQEACFRALWEKTRPK